MIVNPTDWFQNEEIQVDALAALGAAPFAEALRAQLLNAGLGEADAARFKAPAGLDIGAIEPEEIALSIFAEIISWRRGRMAGAST